MIKQNAQPVHQGWDKKGLMETGGPPRAESDPRIYHTVFQKFCICYRNLKQTCM